MLDGLDQTMSLSLLSEVSMLLPRRTLSIAGGFCLLAPTARSEPDFRFWLISNGELRSFKRFVPQNVSPESKKRHNQFCR
jgi:hypothetical protein